MVARHILTGAGFGAQVAVEPADLAGRQRGARQPRAGKAFEHIVVDAAYLLLGGDGLGGFGVPDHQIGVGTDRDRTFARVEVEDAGAIRRGHGDEFLLGEPSGIDARGPEHRQPILESAGAVRDLREVVAAHPLLLGGESAVIGRHHLQRARLQTGP
jgi:hypothetical protein